MKLLQKHIDLLNRRDPVSDKPLTQRHLGLSVVVEEKTHLRWDKDGYPLGPPPFAHVEELTTKHLIDYIDAMRQDRDSILRFIEELAQSTEENMSLDAETRWRAVFFSLRKMLETRRWEYEYEQEDERDPLSYVNGVTGK